MRPDPVRVLSHSRRGCLSSVNFVRCARAAAQHTALGSATARAGMLHRSTRTTPGTGSHAPRFGRAQVQARSKRWLVLTLAPGVVTGSSGGGAAARPLRSAKHRPATAMHPRRRLTLPTAHLPLPVVVAHPTALHLRGCASWAGTQRACKWTPTTPAGASCRLPCATTCASAGEPRGAGVLVHVAFHVGCAPCLT